MKYLCLIYGEEDKLFGIADTDSPDEAECHVQEAALRKSGHLLAGAPPETATTVRVRIRPLQRRSRSHRSLTWSHGQVRRAPRSHPTTL